MSSTAPDASVLPEAPWKSLFNQHLSKMESPEFVLGTVASAPEGSTVPYVPRVRYCIFRGFWTQLPENKHNDAERNPKAFESDCPTFTTDVRMEKVGQLFGTGAGHAQHDEQTQGSGGGGPVEAVYWVKEMGTQWRIKGKAYVVGNDIEEHEDSSGVRTVKSEVGKRMRVVDQDQEKAWSWSRELTACFGNQSPGIKGSFKGPPPGRPTTKSHDDKNLQLGAKVEDLHDETARKNFRLVIIVPESVEQTDLSDPANARRYLYTFHENAQVNAGWTAQELWP